MSLFSYAKDVYFPLILFWVTCLFILGKNGEILDFKKLENFFFIFTCSDEYFFSVKGILSLQDYILKGTLSVIRYLNKVGFNFLS